MAQRNRLQSSRVGENIEINRFYNSKSEASGLFGFGWSTKYDESLTVYDGQMVRLNLPDAKGIYFGRPSTNSTFLSVSPDMTGQIVKNSDSTYTLTFQDGRIHKFDATGLLLWQRDRNGNQTTLNFNANNQLTSITDWSGRTLTLVPNANGKVSQISDSLGVIADYEYDSTGILLKTVTYQDGSKYKFDYITVTVNGVPKTFLSTVKDALDNILETHLYDSQGRAYTSEKQGGAEKYTLDYTWSAYTTVTDGLGSGRVTKYYYDRKYGKSFVTSIVAFCTCSGSTSATTSYQYDYNTLNLTGKTDALGRQTTYEYDADSNVKKITDWLGIRQFTYNAFGEVLTYTDRMNGVWTNTFDANGNLRTTTDPLNHTTTLSYPSTNNKGLPDSLTDARSNVTTFTWFANSDRLDKITDPYGKITSFTFDARGRTKSVTNAKGFVTAYDYFDHYTELDDDQVLQPYSRIEMTYPNLDKVTYRYDKRRLLDRITDERGKITKFEYDNVHRLTKVTDPLGHYKQFGYNSMSFMTTYTDPTGKVTSYAPDDFDRLKEIDYPVKGTGYTALNEKFEYDLVGRLFKHTDTTNARWTQFDYNDTARTVTTSIKRGTDQETVSTVGYNQRFQSTDITDAAGQHYQFSYDPLGRVLSETRAGASMSYTYDESENPKTRTDYAGRLTNYTFDKLNRLTNIEYDTGAGNSTPKLQNTYVYDEISRLKSAANEVGTVDLTYDSRNRIQTTTDVFGHVLTYEYERTPMVNQQRLKLDGSLYASYNFDDAENLSSIVNAADSSTISFQYDPENKITKRIYPNGVSTDYSYFDDDTLKEIKDYTSSSTLFDRQYAYQTTGCVSDDQICQITEPSLTRSFTYDLADRLSTVTASNNQNENYSFDHVGNRTSSHLASSYTYKSGQFNQLATAVTPNQTVSYDFDANGNMSSKSEGSNFWRYTWDHENRLTRAISRKQTVQYKFDALGRRVAIYAGTKGQTKITYDGDDALLDDVDGTQTKYLNGIGIDKKLRQTTGSSTGYFLSDHLGSTTGLTEQSGNLTASNSYDSFGNPTNANFPTRYQFTGREFDSLTGLQYNRARWYDPNIGRFISEDPIGFGGGDQNLYAYVWSRPQSFRDPLGLDPFKLPANPGQNGENMPEGWRKVPEHSDPNNPGTERWVSPSGDEGLEFHPGKPGAPGDQGYDHWHEVKPRPGRPDRWDKEDEHLQPGDEVDLKDCFATEGGWGLPDFPVVISGYPSIVINPAATAAGVTTGVIVVGGVVFWVLS